MVLVDTSIWIEFFNLNPEIDLKNLQYLILEQQVVTCNAIYAELSSGHMSQTTNTLFADAFHSMPKVDRNWNDFTVWEELGMMEQTAQKHGELNCSLIDRMIVLCAREAKVSVWTLDKKLKRLASLFSVPCLEVKH
jgi:predicted nucleic acid-binding protein